LVIVSSRHVEPSGDRRMMPWPGEPTRRFPPSTSSLDPGDASTPGFPQFGHGSIRLTVLFNDPRRIE
jgi:hypothetical protein